MARKCKRCGTYYEVIGEDDGLCPSCTFDELMRTPGDVEIYASTSEAKPRRIR